VNVTRTVWYISSDETGKLGPFSTQEQAYSAIRKDLYASTDLAKRPSNVVLWPEYVSSADPKG
jgi:hypothetical protein